MLSQVAPLALHQQNFGRLILPIIEKFGRRLIACEHKGGLYLNFIRMRDLGVGENGSRERGAGAMEDIALGSRGDEVKVDLLICQQVDWVSGTWEQ